MDLQKVEDKVLPKSRKPPTSKIEGGERLKNGEWRKTVNLKNLIVI